MSNHRISTAGVKCLQVIKALKGHSIQGLSNSELAKRLGETAPSINRSVETLISEGFVEKNQTGRFALSVTFLQIAAAHEHEINSAIAKANELKNRVNAGVIQ